MQDVEHKRKFDAFIDRDPAKLNIHPCNDCEFREYCKDNHTECKLYRIYTSTGKVNPNHPKISFHFKEGKMYVEY